MESSVILESIIENIRGNDVKFKKRVNRKNRVKENANKWI